MAYQRRNRNHALAAATALASVTGVLGTLYYLDIPSLLRRRLESRKVEPRCYSSKIPPSLTAFKALTNQITLQSTYPLCSGVNKNIPIYDCNDFDLADAKQLDRLQDELYHNLLSGPGVYVMKHFYNNLATIDQASAAFDAIIEAELQATGAKGDHFAPASANSRIWKLVL